MSRSALISIVLIVASAAAAGHGVLRLHDAERSLAWSAGLTVDRHPYVTEKLEVVEGSTFGTLMAEDGVPPETVSAIIAAAAEVYDLSKVRLGRTLDVTRNRDEGTVLMLAYRIDSEERLTVNREGDGWTAVREDIPYEVTERIASGTVETSMYEAGLDAGLDERAIIALSDVFQWELDFAMDVRKGDTFTFLFEERHLNGAYEGPGAVLAAKYVNEGVAYYAFRYRTPDGEVGYYNDAGESVQKMFLKAPVHFKYITSGFTTGLRYVSAFNVSTGHRAIDYAAPAGTPIRAVGDGVVVGAGWNGPYGNWTSIRHNATYTTNYAHQSRIAVRKGQRVSQGEIIGYVGSTGFSTGPHLHYEMVKNGAKINPLRETFPSTAPVPEGSREDFLSVVGRLRPRIDG